jgi:methionyl-tRNA formyltransferase
VVATEPLVTRLADQLSPEAAALVGRWGQAPDDGPPLSSSPGEVLAVVEGLGMVVATGGCPLLIRAAQLEGKAVSRGTSLVQQLGARVGDRLG